MSANKAAKIDWKLESTALPLFPDAPSLSLTARLTRFDAAPFDPAWFHLAGIACPDSVARSVPRRQREYFFGRLCAQHALQAAATVPAMAAVEIASGAAREPIWPDGIVGSITHSASFAAAIIAPSAAYAGIGIDIETVPSAAGLDALATTVLSSDELRLLRSVAGATTLPLLITAVFSAKESFFKASYADVGRYFEFDAVSVRAINLESGAIELEQHVDLCRQMRAGARHAVRFGRLEQDTVCTLHTRRLG